ncbi:MAG: hypothetical protein ACTSRI_14935 [Promethearchaeota archaeon]
MMNKEEINSIFKEMARKIFNEQEEKYSRKKKYKEQYYCSDDEVDSLNRIFESLISNPEGIDRDYLVNLFKIRDEEEEEEEK